MTASCPNCGAPIEFRYDDSFVRVCGSCRHAVARTDRGVDSLGKVADLTPIDSPLALFAEGRIGNRTLMLVGMAQIRHAAGGIWQEWYAKLDGGAWGWLAEAQGRYYLTFEQPPHELPAFESLVAGSTVDLPPRRFTVAEHTSASYVAAAGELPYRFVPEGSFRYVDLDDGAGTFGTIDYGEPGDTPALYVGKQVTLEELGIHGGAASPRPTANITARRLACPQCNAPIELRAPGESQRVVCAYCNSLVSLDGELALVGKLSEKAKPAIPLGSVAKLPDGEMTVIGYLQRSAHVAGSWYPFEEYLLHAAAVGFRWLVCSDGHWSYVQPVAVGAVEQGIWGTRYDGVLFRRFASAKLRVDRVLGEFYWKVSQDETVDSSDYIAPPAMLSLERTDDEQTWSLSTYMTRAQVHHALDDSHLPLPAPVGRAPNQPARLRRVGGKLFLGMLAVLVVGVVGAATQRKESVYRQTIPIAVPDPAATEPAATFSEPFQLKAGRNIEVHFASRLDNDWLYVAADLVNQDTGSVIAADANLEYWSGVEDGESWSEGTYDSTTVITPQPAGTYVLRIEGQRGKPGPDVDVTVRQSVFRARYWAAALLLLAIPWLLVVISAARFERQRLENAT